LGSAKASLKSIREDKINKGYWKNKIPLNGAIKIRLKCLKYKVEGPKWN
jgi:hypothetical protein